MKRTWGRVVCALWLATGFFLASGARAEEATPVPGATSVPEVRAAVSVPQPPTIQIDKTSLDNGGTIVVTGKAPAGKPVFIEVWAEKKVRASRFDADPDKETGKRPYILYMTGDMPAYYKMFVPQDQKEKLAKAKAAGKKWSFSELLKDVGADVAYSAPTKSKIDSYQATLMGSIIGSRGELLPPLDDKDNKKRSMQLVKAKFLDPNKVVGTDVVVNPDGSYRAEIKIRQGLAPGKYSVAASVGKASRSEVASFENNIGFPSIYLANAGSSINIFEPFFLTLAIAIFGVLMGAGGGFIMNPLFVSLWALPHTVVAGTVMPTILFSQGSGIYNYSKIKFISWKLGVSIGLAMVLGGFIGPKLTELITVEQFKFVFGWILIILSGLMFWQTMPGYIAKNKKEQAILKEFKQKAEAAAQNKKN